MGTLRSRFLGVGAVTLYRVERKPGMYSAVACCQSRTWLVYADRGRITSTPLSLGGGE